MTKIVFALLLLMFCLSVFSQTTIEEYEYITKEYRRNMPIRQGYKIEDIKSVEYANGSNATKRTFNFKALIRTDSGETAAIMVEYIRISSGNGKTYFVYFCIPKEKTSEYIWQQVRKSLNDFETDDLKKAYNWALTNFISRTF
ncbi:MAG: hypothetical protein ACK5L7_08365 [Paludibacteraceae bacterium]